MLVQIIRVPASSRSLSQKKERKKSKRANLLQLYQVVMVNKKEEGTQGKLEKLG